MKIYLDGKLVNEKDAVVSVFDHSFLYGDGVFEGINAYNGRVFRLNEHVMRLYESAKAIELTIPISQEEMKEAILETLRVNKLETAYIRPVISRGAGSLGLDPDNCKRPTVVIIATGIKVYPEEVYEKGLKAITASTRRIVTDSLSPRIKSCNYLNNILARLEAKRACASEAIFLDRNGYVSEGSADNIFIVKGEIVKTTPTYIGILEGITREAVMQIAQSLGYEVKEEVFTPFDIYTADECFLTGTAVEIAPVTWLDGKTIGTGVIGPITNAIRNEFLRISREEGTSIS